MIDDLFSYYTYLIIYIYALYCLFSYDLIAYIIKKHILSSKFIHCLIFNIKLMFSV